MLPGGESDCRNDTMSLIAELKRRNGIRAAGLYLVGAWLLVQVAGTILPMFGAPDWIARSIVIVGSASV